MSTPGKIKTVFHQPGELANCAGLSLVLPTILFETFICPWKNKTIRKIFYHKGDEKYERGFHC
ncbi:hypothetical protein, partial [Klebsiella aerogenes]|uniref:hypothetical protein n=1 Tax=Klebsiella aerogenes TaxID=548 RepID=UPI001CFAB15A